MPFISNEISKVRTSGRRPVAISIPIRLEPGEFDGGVDTAIAFPRATLIGKVLGVASPLNLVSGIFFHP